MPCGGRSKKRRNLLSTVDRATRDGQTRSPKAAELAAERDKQQASKHAKAIDEYEAEIKALREKLSQASVDAVKASEKSASLSAASATSALEATKLILARAESLEASREDAPDDAKKAASLDGLN